jgi:hypothetical protein
MVESMKKLVVLAVVVLVLAGLVSAASDKPKKDKEDKPSAVSKGKAVGVNKTGGKEAGEGSSAGKVNKTGRGPVQAVAALNKSVQKAVEKEAVSNASIQARLRVMEKLRQKIQEEERNVEQETRGNKDKTKQFKNQNIVRERVMSLLALRNMTGERGIGEQVAEVAMRFNNSIRKTQKAEERINKRSGLMRFLFGGNHDAADEIQGEVARNRKRIQQLEGLKEGTGDDIREFIEEQVAGLEVEQNRLQGLASREKASKGIFGWLWK